MELLHNHPLSLGEAEGVMLNETANKNLSASPARVGHGPYKALVLVEDENDMWLAMVGFREPPECGATFQFRGEVWQLFWVNDCGARAEPAVM